MTRNWYGRLVVVVGALLLAAYFLYPSYVYYFEASEEQRDSNEKFCAMLPEPFACSKFNLGLDLQGGVHLVMGVRADRAVENRADRLADALRDELKKETIAFARIDRPRDTALIRVTLAPETDRNAFETYLNKEFSILQVTGKRDAVYELEIIGEEVKAVRENAVEQAIKTIRNRADKLGVTEPTIARRGEENILIQLPGIKDPERAITLIGKTAQLEFKIVDDEATAVFDEIPDSELPAGTERDQYTYDGPDGRRIREVFFTVPESQQEALLNLLTPKLPGNREVLFSEEKAPGIDAKVRRFRTYVLDVRPGITGDYLSSAAVQQNPELPTDYYVTMTFDTRGGKIFENLTQANVLRRMAIVLDGRVNSAPQIQEKIGGGTARITLGGGGDPAKKLDEAKDLSLVLKAGALPAPVELREKRQVGRSLGQDAVRSGAWASLIGAIGVILFMLIYYRVSGLYTTVALVLNLGLILAAMSFLEATLTMPGIAGIVLTIGMAVDANIIILERIREELAIGKTPRAAIDAGYGKAFSAIFDANVTTLLIAVVLMQYGTGPVRGFAVTLFIGVCSSLFTAIVVTRLLYDWTIGARRLRTLSI